MFPAGKPAWWQLGMAAVIPLSLRTTHPSLVQLARRRLPCSLPSRRPQPSLYTCPPLVQAPTRPRRLTPQAVQARASPTPASARPPTRHSSSGSSSSVRAFPLHSPPRNWSTRSPFTCRVRAGVLFAIQRTRHHTRPRGSWPRAEIVAPTNNTYVVQSADQRAEFQKNPVDGFSAGLVDDDNILEWSIVIIGCVV